VPSSQEGNTAAEENNGYVVSTVNMCPRISLKIGRWWEGGATVFVLKPSYGRLMVSLMTT